MGAPAALPCRSRLLRVLAAALAVLAVRPVGADVVMLRNGQRIEGRVRLVEAEVEITRSDGSVVRVKRAEVARIERAPATPKPEEFRITDELRARVREHLRLKALGRQLTRGGREAAGAARKLRDAGPDALPFLVAALNQEDERVQRLALRALGAVGVPAATDAIVERLGSLPPPLQLVALAELARVRSVRATPAIATLLRGAKTPPTVSRAAIAALGRINSDLALPALLHAFTQPRTSQAAADALTALRSPGAIAYLARIVERKGALAHLAAKIIGATARPEHALLLLRMKQNADIRIRNAAAAGLRRLKADKTRRIATYIVLLASREKTEADRAAAQLRTLTRYDAPNRREWETWWLEQHAARVRIDILPLGDVRPALPRAVARAVRRETGVDTLVAPRSSPLRWARVPGSRRYRSDAMLDHIAAYLARSPHVIAAVGITKAPIEAPGSGLVMCSARPNGQGVVSLAGLGVPVEDRRFRPRLLRCSLHVLARALRVARADFTSCPATALYEPAELDRLRDVFSAKTAGSLKHSIAASVALLAGNLNAATRELRQVRDVADPASHAAELARLAERKLDLPRARSAWAAAEKATTDPARKALLGERIDLIDTLTKAKADGEAR